MTAALSCAVMTLTGSFANAQETEQMAMDTYRLNVSLADGTIDVHAELHEITRKETICLPALGQRDGEFLLNVSLKKADGSPVKAKPDPSGCFSALSMEQLIVDYRLGVAELPADHYWQASALSPVRHHGMIAFPGESMFIERGANNSPSKAGKTSVEIRHAGQIVSTLSAAEDLGVPDLMIQNKSGAQLQADVVNVPDIQAFISEDRFELTRSYWAMGHMKVMTAISDKISWQLVYDKVWSANAGILEREILRILEYYATLLPEKTPKHVAVYLFEAPFDANYRHGFARPGGIILQMGLMSGSQAGVRRVLMAHELFHLFNGEGLRFDEQKFEETSWFREGMTQYMAFRSLLALGLISRDQMTDWMGESIRRQTADYYDAYHHGFFMSLAIEQQWALYKTSYTLDGFWRFMASGDAWKRAQTNATIQSQLTLYSAFDFTTFFKKYAARGSRLPVEDLLRLSGLCYYKRQSVRHSIGVEYEFDPKRSQLYVKSLDARGTGAQAGLKKGDVIVPSENMDWQDGSDKRLTVVRGNRRISLKVPAVTEVRSELSVTGCQ